MHQNQKENKDQEINLQNIPKRLKMKDLKRILFSLFLLAVVFSCSNDDVTDLTEE